MGINAKSKGGNYIPAPADVHNAICVGVYDLGTQLGNFGPKRQLCLLWELDCKKDDGKNFVVSRRYGLSLHPKAEFRKLLESWSGRKVTQEEEDNGFDAAKLLGRPCALQIIHNSSNGNTYANVGSVTKLMKGMNPMKPTVVPSSYSVEDDGKNIPAGVPEWIQKLIKESQEWNSEAVTADGSPAAEFDTETIEEQAAATF